MPHNRDFYLSCCLLQGAGGLGTEARTGAAVVFAAAGGAPASEAPAAGCRATWLICSPNLAAVFPSFSCRALGPVLTTVKGLLTVFDQI